jgi:DNA repair protein RadC
MEVAEIKVFYSSNNLERIKVTNSQILYSLVLKQWNLDIIEYQEEVKIVLLNRAQIVLGIYELSKGGVSGTVVDIKIILGIALKCNASSIVLAHNHPSGNLQPSEPDKSITQKLKEASKMLDLNLLDHLIITKEGYYSFSDNGIL